MGASLATQHEPKVCWISSKRCPDFAYKVIERVSISVQLSAANRLRPPKIDSVVRVSPVGRLQASAVGDTQLLLSLRERIKRFVNDLKCFLAIHETPLYVLLCEE